MKIQSRNMAPMLKCLWVGGQGGFGKRLKQSNFIIFDCDYFIFGKLSHIIIIGL